MNRVKKEDMSKKAILIRTIGLFYISWTFISLFLMRKINELFLLLQGKFS